MTPFRNWVHNLWLENCEERSLYNNTEKLSKQEYFQRFKWWLKREYRHQTDKEIEREKISEQFRQWS